MDIEDQCKRYEKYWKLQESLPQLEEGKAYSRQDVIKVVEDLRKNQPKTFKRTYTPLKEHGSLQQQQYSCKILQWNLLAQGKICCSQCIHIV